jgi:hypothetical protein
MRFKTPSHWLSILLSLLGIVASVAMLLASGKIIQEHALVIRSVGQDALSLASRIPPLEERETLLKRQVELSKQISFSRLGSLKEQLNTFVLSPHAADRAIASLTVVTDAMRAQQDLRDISPIEVGKDAEESSDSTLTFTVTVNDEGMRILSRFFSISGLLTVYSALTPDQAQHLLALTERDNPTGIVALGQFLSTDLSKYLLDPSAYDRRLLVDYSSTAFAEELGNIMGASFFDEEGAFLRGSVGSTLLHANLWPLPFLMVEKEGMTELPDEWYKVSFVVRAAGAEM